ncbi:hypothetical protein M9H77_29658 [Catharanthus roseus]|uniref:Uncharacterized protein n=1 Tax=Catharanthus roseus TaxID=4058 RepID=A0ACB9ZYX0_CATRO|nr:hypothetical protein M9H77_29658 [Catharanthus roseus]
MHLIVPRNKQNGEKNDILNRRNDVKRMGQSPMELKLGPITKAQRRRLKIHEVNGMVSYMVEALKSKLEGHPTVADMPLPAPLGKLDTYLGDLGKLLNQIHIQLKIHIKVVPEKPLIEGFKISN